jgi:dTDP-4-amino-4,6-dideoxygalactose transaminase
MTREPALLGQPAEGPWVYEQQALGYNTRMTDLQAALGLSQLQRLHHQHARRSALAERYDGLLYDLPVILPARRADRVSAWHLYAIEIDHPRLSRRAVFDALRAADIGVNVHYIPIHSQPYYRQLGFKVGDFPAAEAYYARAISLPLFPAMSHAEQDHVVHSLRDALA